jgi:multidrug efflux pump subunit AcrB
MKSTPSYQRDIIGLFAHHPVAANLLMVIMILGGLFALNRLNVQFFPTFDLDIVSVRVVWTSASAEDIEDGITNPLEQRLRNIDNLSKMTSTSSQGICSITLEFAEDVDPLLALDQVRRAVDDFRNFPQDAEKPEVSLATRYEKIARVLITGTDDINELRHLARRFETELLDRGIDQIEINGLPEQEISIQVDHLPLQHLMIGLNTIGERVAAASLDLPAGIVGRSEAARELRSLSKCREPLEFAEIPVLANAETYITLGDIAQIERQARDGAVTLTVQDEPVVELVLQRSEQGNTLKSAQILEQWLEQTRPTLPPNIQLIVYDASWQLVRDRIMLLVGNGLSGLILVVVILYLFLTGRVAFWIAWGIPVSFAATLFILYLTGGSINMITLFALIMALGIIVDDAIVVGEDAQAHYNDGEQALLAAEGGAKRMMAPVIASSLTTIAAFLPLVLVGGRIGNILGVIPVVIIAAIIASLIESFFILPGHLRHAFVHSKRDQHHPIRDRLDRGFCFLRDQLFRPAIIVTLQHRFITLATTMAVLIIGIGLLASGRIHFVFFPTPEPQIIYANVTFVAGTPPSQVDHFLQHLETTLTQTEKQLSDEPLVQLALTFHGSKSGPGGGIADQLGALQVELTPSDTRSVRNQEFIRTWREHINLPPGLEQLTITSRRVGPPGRDVTVRLTGSNAQQLKLAALELTTALAAMPGVLEVEDDLAYGREQLIYSLTPAGDALGVTIADLGQQLRTAFAGQLVQIFQDGADEVEVRVTLPETERASLASLHRLNIRTPDGQSVPLMTVAQWRSRLGFEVLRHADGQLAVEVTADLDTATTTANQVLDALRDGPLETLRQTYSVGYSFEGRSADQRDTLSDMRTGLLLGLVLIYIILTWVFASYGWPLVVLIAIPFGLIGALFGHWFMGIDMTILSLFGLFGLSGIVINDSIILVSFYQRLRQDGLPVHQALVEAACQRLRAVLLTSLTTIAGLIPLLFERSYQAQFLVPMATSIAFGLGFGTVLVLLVIPTLLSIHETIHDRLRALLLKIRGGYDHHHLTLSK